MSTIHITREHELEDRLVRDAAQRLADRLAREYKAEYSWDGDSVVFSYSGLDGVIRLDPGRVDVRVKLGLLLRPMRKQIERGVAQALDKALAGAARGG